MSVLFVLVLLSSSARCVLCTLADNVKNFIQGEGAIFQEMRLKEFIFVIIVLFFMRPALQFRVGERHGGINIRRRGLRTLMARLTAYLDPGERNRQLLDNGARRFGKDLRYRLSKYAIYISFISRLSPLTNNLFPLH